MVQKAKAGCSVIVLAFFAFVAMFPVFDSNSFSSVRHVRAPNLWHILPIFAAVAVAFFAAVAVGEVGFVAAALAVGFDIERARIGLLLITATPTGFHVEVDRHVLSDIPEVCITKLGRMRQKLAVFFAGRSAANTIAGLCILLLLLIGAIKPSSYFGTFCVCFVGVSMLVAIIDLIPSEGPSGRASSGTMLLNLRTSKEKAQRLICLNAVQMQSESGVRPRDWKQTWITHACAIRDGSACAFMSFWLAYLHAVDSGDISSAAQHLEACLERIRHARKDTRRLVLTEAAVYQALHRIDSEKANVWFELSKAAGSAPPLMESRLLACMHLVRSEYAEMMVAWQKGLDYIEALPESRQKDTQRLGWLEWKDYLEKKRAAREQAFGQPALS